MKIYGLIGNRLENSFSKEYFLNKFKEEKITNTKYLNFDLDDISKLPSFIKKNKINGLNVTMPFKEQVIPFLDDLSDDAKLIGAVNTIKIHKQKMIGYNTDHIGFRYSIQPILNKRKKALILGDGGASKAIKYALNKINIEYKTVNRNTSFDYSDLNEKIINYYDIIINTTPLGTLPEIKKYPKIPYEYINNQHLLFDLIYNPKETKFLKYGKKNNALTVNGLQMLKIQAEESWKIWNF